MVRPHGRDMLLEDLSQLVAEGQVLPIVGAGISLGATGDTRVASWIGLLEHGIGPADNDLFVFAETAEEVWNHIQGWYEEAGQQLMEDEE